MSNRTLQQRRTDATPRGIGVMCPFFIERARNAELWDTDGNRYIDFAGGIGVLNTGHLHPKIQAAVSAQLESFSHTCFQVVPYESYIRVAEELNRLTPGDFPKKTAFFTTGAEAVENAVKIARAATGRAGVIAFGGAFHGRTMMGMALTGKVAPYKTGFGPFPGEVYHAPFPNPLRDITVDDAIGAVEKLFKYDVDPKRIAAIIFEPVQGEGGFYSAPPQFVVALRRICDEHGILLIADEVQAGFGRTGKLFAMEHYSVHADLITLAKSLAGGFPLSAVTGRAEWMDAPQPGGLGGTYAGNPLALAAAAAVIDLMQSDNLPARAERLGHQIKERLVALRQRVPAIADVRGPGGMVAVEFSHPGGREPDAEFARAVQAKALADGLILLTCGSDGNVIRFLFPLTIEDAVFEEALGKLETAILHTMNGVQHD
ncbi:4-aminobutyrate--2-oxoglutarate transaminase [Paludibacterium paludis]|uniref:4-aminobutyrate transaminase n=1 Tax=Paludibacterium paludis TaxID=1225769 RepID=A0A918P051_9NEIS|nr:4-aminobutyrate--2-oxoglutarate transaminase [Paludibacterium paludis]GGY08681.1 4-aminobutyrate transaminase [Paludibacterium paludis]